MRDVVCLVCVIVDDVPGRADTHELALAKPCRLVAEGPHLIHRMRDDDHGPAFAAQIGELLGALLLEGYVADREHLVDQQDVGLDMD